MRQAAATVAWRSISGFRDLGADAAMVSSLQFPQRSEVMGMTCDRCGICKEETMAASDPKQWRI